MKNKMLSYALFLLLINMNSCLEGGTHGSIKYYQYNVSKQILERAVQSVIKNSNTIEQDSIRRYYNNDTTYVTIFITYSNVANEYTFRYGGNKEYWDTSKQSSISIAYAYNKEKIGGSAASSDINWHDYKLRKELIEPFEQEFVFKINEILGMKPFEEK